MLLVAKLVRLIIAAVVLGAVLYVVLMYAAPAWRQRVVASGTLSPLGLLLWHLIGPTLSRAFESTVPGGWLKSLAEYNVFRGKSRCDTGILDQLDRLGISFHQRAAGSKEQLSKGGLVFWPVTITGSRVFDNIHAAQCMVLRQLRRSGFRIGLYLFDDRPPASVDRPEDIARACTNFHKYAKSCLGGEFDDFARTSQLWSRPWAPLVRWRLRRNLEDVLRTRTVGDFAKFATKRQPSDQLPSAWPMWHFVEPALTLAFLLQFCSSRRGAVMTISGADERDMWQQLMNCPRARHSDVSHLYIPRLDPLDPAADPHQHVAWATREQIRASLNQYSLPVPGETGNMFDWIVRHFVCVPGLGGAECRLGRWTGFSTPEQFWEFTESNDKEAVIDAIVDGLSKDLLRGQ